tara:strand:- start:61 stop:228 length:168 start_codon:yes stop_codon:yes gene_type:complete
MIYAAKNQRWHLLKQGLLNNGVIYKKTGHLNLILKKETKKTSLKPKREVLRRSFI